LSVVVSLIRDVFDDANSLILYHLLWLWLSHVTCVTFYLELELDVESTLLFSFLDCIPRLYNGYMLSFHIVPQMILYAQCFIHIHLLYL
jgi:hypothetical protein